MGFFRKDAEQPSPIANESGTSSPSEKLGDNKLEDVVLPTRVVDEAEEQRLIRKLDRRIVPMMVLLWASLTWYDHALTLNSLTGLDVFDEVSLSWHALFPDILADHVHPVLWIESPSVMPDYTEWKMNSGWSTTTTSLQSPSCSSPTV
jgi:hypothetical protein